MRNKLDVNVKYQFIIFIIIIVVLCDRLRESCQTLLHKESPFEKSSHYIFFVDAGAWRNWYRIPFISWNQT